VFSTIPDILEDVRAGKFIILVDDEDRENEGDLVLAAQFATPDRIQQMNRLAEGYMCLSLTSSDCDRLGLLPMAGLNTSLRGTPFTVSIDGSPRHGVGTGVSAHDRAKTIALAIDPASTPDDFVRPGHINPLRARDGGVLVRTGQTEGSVDLARLAGLHPSALIIEILRPDGQMARRPDLERLCQQHGLKMCSVEQLISYRLERDTLVKRQAPIEGETLRTSAGEFTLYSFASLVDPLPHLALTMGGVGQVDRFGAPIDQHRPTLVRMHRRHLLGDVFGDLTLGPDGPTRDTLRAAMEAIAREGHGAIVYLRPEGQGDSTEQRLTTLRRKGQWSSEPAPIASSAPAVPMHLREYGIGGQVLRALGLSKLRLLSNHPKALPGLEAFGLEIVEHVPLLLPKA